MLVGNADFNSSGPQNDWAPFRSDLGNDHLNLRGKVIRAKRGGLIFRQRGKVQNLDSSKDT